MVALTGLSIAELSVDETIGTWDASTESRDKPQQRFEVAKKLISFAVSQNPRFRSSRGRLKIRWTASHI